MKVTEQPIVTFDSHAEAIAKVLRKWRENHGFSIYAVAKTEDCRQESIRRVEEGRGNIQSLLQYFDFIRCKDRSYLDCVLSDWAHQQGFE